MRSSLILGRVRRKLHAIGIQEFTDTDIYDEMQEAQREIIAQTKCLEQAITLSTVAAQQAYPLSDLLVGTNPLADKILIKDIIVPTTYDDPVIVVRNNVWQQITQQDPDLIIEDPYLDTQPLYLTIFGDTLYLYPIPANTGDIITIWAYLLDSINQVGAAQELEVQSYFDKAVEYFVISQFSEELSKKYYPMFLDEINRHKETPQLKNVGIRIMDTHW